MHRYPADAALIQGHLRGSFKMLGLSMFLALAGVAIIVGFTLAGRLAWATGVLAGLLILVSLLLLLRTRATRKKLSANLGSEYVVSDIGLTLFQTGTIPWEKIRNVAVIDTSHQLSQMRAGAATRAGFGVYGLNLIVRGAESLRSQCDKAVTVGPHGLGIIAVELDPFIGIEAAQDAIAKTVDAAISHGIPVKVLASSGESFGFVFDEMAKEGEANG